MLTLRRNLTAWVVVAAAIVLARRPVRSGDVGLSAAEVLRRVDQAMFPDSTDMQVTLTDYRPKSTHRTFTIQVKTARKTGSLLALLSPATEVGKKYLFKDRNIWIALPGMPNLIRVSSKEGFMDSNFANSDLMDTEYSDDYDVAIERIAGTEGRQAYLLKCTARSPQVTYHAIRMTVDFETFIPEQFEYFTRSGLPLKTCTFGERKLLAGRLRASRIEMRDSAVSNSYSVISIQKMAEARFASAVFSIESIRK